MPTKKGSYSILGKIWPELPVRSTITQVLPLGSQTIPNVTQPPKEKIIEKFQKLQKYSIPLQHTTGGSLKIQVTYFN